MSGQLVNAMGRFASAPALKQIEGNLVRQVGDDAKSAAERMLELPRSDRANAMQFNWGVLDAVEAITQLSPRDHAGKPSAARLDEIEGHLRGAFDAAIVEMRAQYQ